MCEDRIKRRKGNPKRLQRPPVRDHLRKQHQIFMELSLRTEILMKRSQVIQKKIVELKQETSEFMDNMINCKLRITHPEEYERFFGSIASVIQMLSEADSTTDGD